MGRIGRLEVRCQTNMTGVMVISRGVLNEGC
ncbi:hypothetical protein V6Z12_A06G027800 [Gossypium hirsutum]